MSDLLPAGTSLSTGKGLINTKVAALEAADTTEASTRAAADASLQTQITTEQQARIAADTAHANSTTAHSAANITYSGDASGATVKAALDSTDARIDNLVAGAGSSNAEIVDARLGSDGTSHAVLKDRLDAMEQRQLDAQDQTATLAHGLNYLDTDIASDLQVQVGGVTLSNGFGKDGNCEDTSKFTTYNSTLSLDSSNKVYGDNSIKVTIASSGDIAQIAISRDVIAGKYYIAAANAKNGTATNLQLFADDVAGSIITSTSFTLAYAKLNPSTDKNIAVFFTLNGATAGMYAYVDGFRLFEVSAADYAAIDTMTADQIAARWPYVDSVQHLKNPILTVQGKNLLPPFTEWTLDGSAVVMEPYKLTLNAAGIFLTSSSPKIKVVPSQIFTFAASQQSGGYYFLDEYDANDNLITSVVFTTSSVGTGTHIRTFTTKSNSSYLILRATNNTTGTFVFSDCMLVLGDSTALPPSFVAANPSYLYAQGTFASNVDRSVRDRLYQQNGQWYKHKRFETGVSL